MLKERVGIITFKGGGLTLLGEEIREGDEAPEFRLVDNALQPVTLNESRSKIRLITVVPSLDTPVCDSMSRRFNEEASRLPEEVVVYTVSMDLPFAQKRWCGNVGIERVVTLSDYKDRSFGTAYGLLIKELMLLARAVYVIDRNGRVAYREIVPEVTDEPDYVAALEAVRALL